MKSSLKRVAAAGVGVICLSTAGFAADYFVDPKGADGNKGSVEKPWKDPVKAAAKLQAGDTLYFRAGTYKCVMNGTVGLAPARSGAEGQPVTFKNFQDEHVIVDCSGSDWGFCPDGWSWITIDGFEILNSSGYAIKISANQNNGKQFGSHVTIRNCELHNTENEALFAYETPWLLIENVYTHDARRSHGIYINKGCHNVILRNITSMNNRGNSGTQINAAGGGTTNALVERCFLTGCAQGYSLMGVIDGTFRNNLIVNDGFNGPRESGYREVIMWTYAEKPGMTGTPCSGNLFENNTFVNLVPEGHKLSHLVHSKAGTKDCTFRNNIFVIRGKPVFTLESFAGFQFENNCLFRIGGGEEVTGGGSLVDFCKAKGLKESGTISKDPLFVDMAKGDFRLKDGSPCVDSGAKAAGTNKLAGAGIDIGAFEKGAEIQIGCKLPWKKDVAPAAK